MIVAKIWRVNNSLVVLIIGVLICFIASPVLCPATDFSVTNNSDNTATVGSLGWAIGQLNTTGDAEANRIVFGRVGTIDLAASMGPVARPVTFENNSGSDIAVNFKLPDLVNAFNLTPSQSSFAGINKTTFNFSGGYAAVFGSVEGGGGINIGTMSANVYATAETLPFVINAYGRLSIGTLSGNIAATGQKRSYTINAKSDDITGDKGIMTIGTLSGTVHATASGSSAFAINAFNSITIGVLSESGEVKAQAADSTAIAVNGVANLAPHPPFENMKISTLAGTVTAIAGESNAIGINSGGTLTGGSADVPVLITGTVSAQAKDQAAAIAVYDSMNLYITGTVSGVATDTGEGYAIRAMYYNDKSGLWTGGKNAKNTITLDGADITGKIDLGNNPDKQNTLNLYGTGKKALNDPITGVNMLTIGNKTDKADWTLAPGVSGSTFDTVNINSNAKLAVNADITSPAVAINAGGTLKGIGSITGDVTNSGTLAPGNSPGTFTIKGNYVQKPGSVLDIELGPEQSDLLHVTGTATLNGGLVKITPTGFLQAGKEYTYTFLQADGGLTGSLALVPLQSSPFYSSYITPSATGLSMTGHRNSFGSVCESAQGCAVGRAIESAYTNMHMTDITDALFTLNSMSAVDNAYNQMAGLVHTATPAVTFSLFNEYMDIQKNRMAGFVSGGPS
ncbi:MAG: hypothetical protein ABFD12_00525, partial [Syntrophorhabdus sp.]